MRLIEKERTRERQRDSVRSKITKNEREWKRRNERESGSENMKECKIYYSWNPDYIFITIVLFICTIFPSLLYKS